MKAKAIRLGRKICKLLVPPAWRPGAYLHAKVLRAANGVVLSGPFQGMKYVSRGYCSALLPKILGTYELELHSIIERACSLEMDRAINIGAAEGYYAVGFAKRRPDIPVIAFELDAEARKTAEELLDLNEVGGVSLRGKCEAAELAELTRDGVSLVVCDCEGYEAELLDIARVPRLAYSPILVETHDFIIPGVTDLICHRFMATHDVLRIPQRDRQRADFPFTDWYIRRMQELDLERAMSEGRPARMEWLWMMPKR